LKIGRGAGTWYSKEAFSGFIHPFIRKKRVVVWKSSGVVICRRGRNIPIRERQKKNKKQRKKPRESTGSI